MSWRSSRNSGAPVPAITPLKILTMATVMLAVMPGIAVAAEEPCNPIIDGTYCATNMPKKSGYVRSSGSSMTGLEDYSRLVPSAAVGGTAGTLIGIGTRGDRTCFGLMRRSACD
jgi:hypothetical protein